ncbi:MAG: glycerophosphodiester phosphodiesterase family protein [Rhodobacterales bacterium]|nr:glycerophosphodiester phosphodiesterase family protein [Rhodobacterales bacterium]
MKRFAFSVISIAVAACGAPQAGGPDAPADAASITPSVLPLPEYFDCLRENKGMAIAAHRGGPDTGFPENAIETFQHGFDRGIRVFEIDIAETKDGVLTLMHDDRLNRTTTGRGYVSDTDWETMSGLELEDNDGRRTGFHPPKFTDVLLWAKKTGAVLELDKKPTTSFRNIAAAVKAAGAEENVIFISYDDDQAAEIAAINPGLMMTATAYGDQDVAKLEARGVDRTRLIGWTGTKKTRPAAWRRLKKVGVEAAFGTLGRAGERLDDVYLADGDGSEYDALAADGLVLLATDEPYRVADLIKADDVGREACGR